MAKKKKEKTEWELLAEEYLNKVKHFSEHDTLIAKRSIGHPMENANIPELGLFYSVWNRCGPEREAFFMMGLLANEDIPVEHNTTFAQALGQFYGDCNDSLKTRLISLLGCKWDNKTRLILLSTIRIMVKQNILFSATSLYGDLTSLSKEEREFKVRKSWGLEIGKAKGSK